MKKKPAAGKKPAEAKTEPSTSRYRGSSGTGTTVKSAAVSSQVPGQVPGLEHAGGRWTFLTNHSHVLILLFRNSSMVLREVAARIGITERAVQRIIADLEVEGFIERKRVGRQNHYRILPDQSLRHPIESHRTIGDILDLIESPPQE